MSENVKIPVTLQLAGIFFKTHSTVLAAIQLYSNWHHVEQRVNSFMCVPLRVGGGGGGGIVKCYTFIYFFESFPRCLPQFAAFSFIASDKCYYKGLFSKLFVWWYYLCKTAYFQSFVFQKFLSDTIFEPVLMVSLKCSRKFLIIA